MGPGALCPPQRPQLSRLHTLNCALALCSGQRAKTQQSWHLALHKGVQQRCSVALSLLQLESSGTTSNTCASGSDRPLSFSVSHNPFLEMRPVGFNRI